MGLSPFIRSIVGGSRFPQLIGQELPNPAPTAAPVAEEVVNSADSAKPKANWISSLLTLTASKPKP